MRNGQEHYEDVKVGKLLPNEDGTFQKTVTLKAEPDEWRKNEYSCVVEHKSKTFRKTLTEKEIRTNNETPASVGMIVAVSVVIILLVIAVLVYKLYQKKGKSVKAQFRQQQRLECELHFIDRCSCLSQMSKLVIMFYNKSDLVDFRGKFELQQFLCASLRHARKQKEGVPSRG
ncbi:hypothetical protein DPX16_23860 [Anabarilius grahami]|uniref:Immunoglobulin C1-set domain-containing protein n=1 Tax=Anabarilius grahami TaxID=495550 RepID=A0A3N0YU85_ANAGA|nr:hypothetical protein DPX16_23860 [Anabarilius grahami]